MDVLSIGLLGASSSLGRALIARLHKQETTVHAWSRVAHASSPGLHWHQLGASASIAPAQPIALWISAAPIWVLSPYLDEIAAAGATRLLAFSSTSRFTKLTAADPTEAATAKKLIEGEAALAAWSTTSGVAHTILQPTLIYGGGDDRNISEIARVIKKMGFFPVLGRAGGLRRPVHVDDLAWVAVTAVRANIAVNKSYIIAGGETLSYREMVERVFSAMGRYPIIPSVPLWAFAIGLRATRLLGLSPKLSLGMAERMNADMDFGSAAAELDFGFRGRSLLITSKDLRQTYP